MHKGKTTKMKQCKINENWKKQVSLKKPQPAIHLACYANKNGRLLIQLSVHLQQLQQEIF